MTQATPATTSIGDQIATVIEQLPSGPVSLGLVVDRLGPDSLLLLTVLLTLVFLIPVSIPGVSTAFGAAILLVGISRLRGRMLWLPQRLRARELPGERLRAGLVRGLAWVRRLERLSRPQRLPALATSATAALATNLAFVFAALLLMAPLGFVPFSNTLPAVALLFYALGMMQRDGGAILLGHLATVATVTYFVVLGWTGGVLLREAWRGLGG
jgi:hypothetical protein